VFHPDHTFTGSMRFDNNQYIKNEIEYKKFSLKMDMIHGKISYNDFIERSRDEAIRKIVQE